ncbi:asparaginase [Nocardia xishanensis]|uniref:asparaginase n=1 Tax=Nocardia xishanensis TaxID=238964 RepID=UPI0033DDEA97
MYTARSARRVTVFALGGTIAMTTTAEGGVAPALSAEQLLAAVPGLAETGIAVDMVDFRQLPGASLRLSDIAALAEAISAANDVDGFVVTQGTDTIEETAYLLDLLHTAPTPIVVTGAMRNPTLAGADGPANLLAAIRTAADPDARDQGCLVVLNDEIHAARRVRKTHTTSTATFASPTGGPLGHLTEGRPRLLNTLTHRITVPAPPRDGLRVPVYTTVLGDEPDILTALAASVDGLVLAGFGVGHVPDRLATILADLADTIPVVLTSRTGAGPVLRSTYGFPGSERDLIARGLIPAGTLDTLKARILLTTLITIGADPATTATAFAVAGGDQPLHAWPWPTTQRDNY